MSISWRVTAACGQVALSLLMVSCTVGGEKIQTPPLELTKDESGQAVFTCVDENTVDCRMNVHFSCEQKWEFLQVRERDCNDLALACDRERGCITCRPGSMRCLPCEADDADCEPNTIQLCDESGDSWHDLQVCELADAKICSEGACHDMCDLAEVNRSYVGCEFYGVDLDNAAIDDRNNAAAQQFAIAVTNPHPIPIDVRVHINEGAHGGELRPKQLASVKVPPGGLEVFELPSREVDGSSPGGLNDGTHTAVSSNAFRVESSHPIVAYQFNPLENVDVFSNDASLLLPTSAVGSEYTVVGWPQTIGDSEDPERDFDSTSSDEDLRAFLTIVGTVAETELSVELGPEAHSVLGWGPIPASGPGDRIELKIGPYDVVNLETEGFNSDFTGTRVVASEPVSVFVGSEASDVPLFGTYATRQCCADHLEEQLFPDATLGFQFNIARMPSRTEALTAAAFEDDPLSVSVVNEPEWVRVVAVSPGTTRLTTTLPFPDDRFELEQLQDTIIRADQDFILDADKRVAVLQALPSQGVTGIPRQFPGGDPAIVAVPPVEQYRKDYIFLTPDKYAFDFITVAAESNAEILLDGEPLPEHCTRSPADGIERGLGDPEPDRVIYRCQLSFPMVTSGVNSTTFEGDQNDGVHTLLSNRDVGIIVYGFDRFVSYAYAGGLDLDRLE